MAQDSTSTNKPAIQSSRDFFQTIGRQVDKVDETNDVAPAIQTSHATDEDGHKVVDEIESLCMNCHENGTTRLLLTSIPFFREIILMSFECPHCGFKNSEVQPAGSIQPRGARFTLRLMDVQDFARQVVKADTATVKLIELDVEIPSGRGQLTNVEGLVRSVVDDLEMDQPARRDLQPDVHEKIAELISRAKDVLDGRAFPFRITVDDPAGNSWIAPDMRDGVGKWEKHEYTRTPEQNAALGLADTAAATAAVATSTDTTNATNATNSKHLGSLGISTAAASFPSAHETGRGNAIASVSSDIIPDEVYTFPATCPGCVHPCVTHMKMVDVPHFQQVILMSTVCDDCGYRSNDVKTGGSVPARGKRITLKVRGGESRADLARDILKSESCALQCPELMLHVAPGTMGGRFTTVEGLLTQVRDDLKSQIFNAPASLSGSTGVTTAAGNTAGGDASERPSDSLPATDREKWDAFFATLDRAVSGDMDFSIVLEDPLASSYVQKLGKDGLTDEQVVEEDYDRTEEEEEELGLRDMKVEGYEDDAKEEKEKAEQQKKEGKEIELGNSGNSVEV